MKTDITLHEKFYRPNIPLQPDRGVNTVTFNMTHSCNLRCKYCYIQNYIKGNETVIPFATAQKFLVQHGSDNMGICFMGGEPTLCMDRVREIVEFAKVTLKNPHFNITTNGTRLMEKMPGGADTITEYLTRENFGMIVSLDGPEEVHDLYRIHADGTGSFKELIRGLESFRNTGLSSKTTLRGTFSAEVLTSPVSLTQRLAYMNQLVYDGYAIGVALEPVDLSESTCGQTGVTGIMEHPEQKELWRKQIFDAAQWFVDEKKAGRSPTWNILRNNLQRLVGKRPGFHCCGAGKSYITCEPDGTICACHHVFDTAMGSVDGGIDPEIYEAKFADNRGYRRPVCVKCPIRYLCGGGCRIASLHATGNLDVPATGICELKRIFAECAIYVAVNCNVSDLLERPKMGPTMGKNPKTAIK